MTQKSVTLLHVFDHYFKAFQLAFGMKRKYEEKKKLCIVFVERKIFSMRAFFLDHKNKSTDRSTVGERKK